MSNHEQYVELVKRRFSTAKDETNMAELLHRYAEQFDESFPLFVLMGIAEEEIESIIRHCLDDGKPHTPMEIGDKDLF